MCLTRNVPARDAVVLTSYMLGIMYPTAIVLGGRYDVGSSISTPIFMSVVIDVNMSGQNLYLTGDTRVDHIP